MHLGRLPEAIKRRVRPLPQWNAVAANAALDPMRVWLMLDGKSFDVTHNHAAAALKPFTLALGLDEFLQRALDRDHNPVLLFCEGPQQHGVASLRLRFEYTVSHENAVVGLFRVIAHRQRCLRWPHRPWNRWMQRRAAAKNTDPANFSLSPEAQQQIMVFYLRPRPVVLVSVECEAHRNIFPMDLIGSVKPDLFTLALRTTSRSVEAMKRSRRIALSDIAAADVAIAHGLGRHHRAVDIEWTALPFALERSMLLSLPVPAIALRVREFNIVDCADVGSHTLFICRQLIESRQRDATALCHISGISQHFRARQGRALPMACE